MRFRTQRMQLLVYVRRDDVWRMPDMYERVRDAIVPSTLPQPGLLTWYSFMPIGPVANRATGGLASEIIQPPISRFLDLAAAQGRLGELGSQVEAAHKRFPGWAPAHAILALIHLRAGDYGEAQNADPQTSRPLQDRSGRFAKRPGASTRSGRSALSSPSSRRPATWRRPRSSTRSPLRSPSTRFESDPTKLPPDGWSSFACVPDAPRTPGTRWSKLFAPRSSLTVMTPA